MEKIVKKIKYYRIKFRLDSPLAIGSGENDRTDKDLMMDSAGNPYIPASSVVGVLRECLDGVVKNQDIKKYLGFVDKANGSPEADQGESSVVFYDAFITEGSPRITVRDSVALDEFKTARKGAKFDMEVLEPGVIFTTYIEQAFDGDVDEMDFGAKIAKEFLAGDLAFGGKGTRGYGRISDASVEKKEFVLTDKKNVEEWLKFDIYDSNSEWDKSDIVDDEVAKLKSTGKKIVLELKQMGGISIRKYTTKVSQTNGEHEPDMEQLTILEVIEEGKKTEIPVIPGTSWAGAIRSRMKEFGVDTESDNSIFGYVKGEGSNEKARSKITFGESQITGAKPKVLSRNAIDRFTGGTVEKALFTERTYYGGTTKLVIEWKGKEALPEKERKALAAALTDLHFGFLAVGGETSIGRGLFCITRMGEGEDDKIIEENEPEENPCTPVVYDKLCKKIEEVFK